MSLPPYFPLIPVLAGLALAAAPPAPPDEAHVERLRPLREIAGGVKVETITPAGRVAFEPLAEPIYLWDDPARRVSQGGMFAWGTPGRPAAILAVSVHQKGPDVRYWLCEMTSLAPAPLSAAVPGGKVWEPGTGVVTRAVPGSPAGDEATRLRQMKEIARRFTAFEFYEPSQGAATERYQLRLLPQPVHRYSDPKSGLVDGALFLFTYGRNPEIVLLIEAHRVDGVKTDWGYGLARTGAARLHVNQDGVEVWQQPRLREHGIHDPYWVFTRPAPDPPPAGSGGEAGKPAAR